MSDQAVDTSQLSDLQGTPIKGERPPDKVAAFRAKSKRRGPQDSPSPKKNPFAKEKYLQDVGKLNTQQTHSPFKARLIEPLPTKPISPKRVTYKRKIQENDGEIERELEALGIDLNDRSGPENWLPLDQFDNSDLDPPSLKDFLEGLIINFGTDGSVLGKGLFRENEDFCSWKFVFVSRYDATEKKFHGIWAHNNEPAKLPRLYLCFDEENTKIFALRIKDALLKRKYADSIIRYNFFISEMPKDDLNELDDSQKSRLIRRALKRMTRDTKLETSSLFREVNDDYAQVMNRLVFDKYIGEASKNMLPHDLVLPQIEPEKVRYSGILETATNTDSKSYFDGFKDFSVSVFLQKEEAIRAMELIKAENKMCLEMLIFNTIFKNPLKLEEFNSQQDSSSSTVIYHLRGSWVSRLVSIIKTEFIGISRGWASLPELKKGTYEYDKFRKFLSMVRVQMRDTVYSLTYNNYNAFVNMIEQVVPTSTIVKSCSDVTNQFFSPTVVIQGKEYPRHAMFAVDVVKNFKEEGSFQYTVSIEKFINSINSLFERTLEDLGKIPDIENRILTETDRKDGYLAVPQLPQNVPADIPEGRGKYRKVVDENKWLWDLHEKLLKLLQVANEPMNQYLVSFNKYKDLVLMDPEALIKEMEEEDPPRTEDSLREEVYKYMKKEVDIRKEIPSEKHVSYFMVNNNQIIELFAGKFNRMQKSLIELIAKRARTKTHNLMNEFVQIESKIRSNPKNIEELTDLQDFIQALPAKMEKMKEEINLSMEIYNIMEEFLYKFSEDDINRMWRSYAYQMDIHDLVEVRKVTLKKEKTKFLEKMIEEQGVFKTEIETIEKIIQSFSQYTKMEEHVEVSNIAQSILDSLSSYQDKARVFNHHESLFGVNITDYNKLNQLSKDFLPYSNLWIFTNRWFRNIKSYMEDPFETLNAPEAEKFVEEAVRTLASSNRFFKDRSILQVLKIGEAVKKEVDEFRPKVPLMVALRKDGMKERHWDQISALMGFTVKPDAGFTFTKALDLGLMKSADAIVEIGDRASKEYNIENMLIGMLKMWETINFELLPFKNTSILRGYDEIGAILDEHIVNTQAMTFSPFKKPFEERLNEWNAKLLLMSNILEEWAKCQGQYMYLQPIFDSADIAKQLPAEFRKFKIVDNIWKTCIHYVKTRDYNVLRVCSVEGILDKISDSNYALEMIQKELNNYLEKKREAFARFYFLSNDELLEILSETKDPTKVQPHLRKVFENINKIEFDEDKIIHSMYSGEGEQVKFNKAVNPNNKNVEFWMGEVEEMMFLSVREVLLNSINDYQKRKRAEWVVSHSGQCVLNGSQVHWTTEVEVAIKEGKIAQYLEKQNLQISELVKLIRTKLSKNQSITINALIVIDVHARDVIAKLVEAKITDIGSFEWISQLRYYWENNDCSVKCVQTNYPYGYEYLGNTLRLVITPLTDKCYITLMGALNLNLGGAPAGPAGTGKTESTKDLAKALAKQCVVFNCSEGMDYTFVGKFFKGLASAGAWACFDEFNRINIEVLSVIAQQLLQLFGAKAISAKDLNFEGSFIKLNPTFSVFITMNPGYAGRTELPDNLKALFRAVAMMVPDYALIGEIMLYSFGFDAARNLAKKMVATFKLSSEQLSSQDHYDYGMRAVRSVINAAGLLKRALPDMNEDQLLLRALRDVNVPKFLKDDLPLFENIISDLFPNIERPKYEYGELLDAINKSCEHMNVQPTEPFVAKVLQLYDTIQVRHGLMLVGPTGGGKTTNYKVLQMAMSSLAKAKKGGFTKVHTDILNPKSITMGQLYGWINEQTKEWTDGILASIVRETVRDVSGELHWIMFDGPVDALWIESMNTVLDDNKKLCLNSGQILILTPFMTMMFEVEDLAVASPATVSRCGMVYMEPVSIGIKPLIDSWMNQLPAGLKAKRAYCAGLKRLFDNFLEDSMEFVKKECKELIISQTNTVTRSLMRMMDCYLEPFRDTEYKKVSPEELDQAELLVEYHFFFSLLWTIGATVDLDGRRAFNSFLRDRMTEKKAGVVFPPEGLVYDYSFNIKNKAFELWLEQSKNFQINDKLGFSEIVVPTNDYSRMLYLMRLLLTNKKHVMCPGPTGTGKSLNSYTLLQSGLPAEYQYITITFSAQTTANQTQDTIDTKMEKRRKGIYGPPPGKKCIIFVDDLNMPKKETYGAQPPIEILRQYLDHDGWYDRKKLEWQRLEDLILMTAMGPPGGGRTHITNRLVRHFNMLTYTELDEDTIKFIFNTILDFFLKKFEDGVRGAITSLVDTVLVVYNTVKAELRPLPNKSFYTFNLRDISKVFQGVCSASVKHTTQNFHIVRLWYHENLRVFHDRLTTVEDRDFLKQLLKDQLPVFNLHESQVIDKPRILYADFMHGRDVEPKLYIQVEDLNVLLRKMNEYLDEYNAESGGNKKQMKLVMFLDACEHICRICRILGQPQGNALLLGVGGSGRQSLARLATYISNYKIFQVEVVKGYNMPKWRDDVKKCLMMAGVDNKQISFLFVDTQIIKEDMLEDINNILNSGDVTNLYKSEDLDAIMNACRGDCLKKGFEPNKMNIFSQYLTRIRRNIHCIIAMSPLGEVFRTRLRMFPSLINCCTIDWFTEWPEEALIGVGQGATKDVAEDLSIEKELNNLVEMFKRVHKSVEAISVKFLLELRRYNYVTPSSYLEQLNLFKIILGEKQVELKKQINRLKNGLDKLREANAAVTQMQKDLVELQPKLEQADRDTTKMMEQLVIEKKDAEEAQITAAKDEAEVAKEQEKASALQKEALEAVADAQKILDKTTEEIKMLKKEHIVEIKAFKSPPMPVFWTLGGVCVMLGERVPAKAVPGSMTGEKKEDYFEYAKEKLLANPDAFLKGLLDFANSEKKNNIPEDVIKRFETKIKPEPDFKQDRVQNANTATKNLWSWVNAMYTYNNTYCSTRPLREKLAATEKILTEKNAQLREKKEQLDMINKTIKRLEDQYAFSIAEKERLSNKKKECEIKLVRAEKLTSGLKDENARWLREVEVLSKSGDVLPGDSIMAAGMVTYAGPFTSQFRQALEAEWIKNMDEIGILHTEGINMRKFLGDSVKIQAWNIAGLPKDDSSTENGIIIDKGKRWPLMIDPQTQANKFIKNLGKDHKEGLDVFKASDPTLLKMLEIAVQLGKWILVENVGTELDPALDPIITRQVYKQGGSLVITIGDKTIPYLDTFKFFMTTTNPNPHYSPETFVKVTIINFAITQSGLEEQMLAQIVALENPQLEQKKLDIVKRNAQDKRELVNIEDEILRSLSESQGDILMDETLINKLGSSKKMSTEINQRVKDSKVTEVEIDNARESYRPVAFRASILFFCITDLSSIDPMYQYSLQWFINLFAISVTNAPASNELKVRLKNLNDFFTYNLYENICRSLFEKHKLLFSLMLAVKILQGDKKMNEEEWRYFLTGYMGDVKAPRNPTTWVPDNSWPGIYRLFYGMNDLPHLKGILDHFVKRPDEFKHIYDAVEAHEQQLPSPWETKLDEFEKLIVLKALRPDKLIPAIQEWVTLKIGKQFVDPPTFNLSLCFRDSSITTPLIFVLSAGSDPVADFLRFAEEMEFTKKYDQISLGQGQGPKAEKLIKEYSQKGGWVLLQNCHLAASWMPELEKICEELNDSMHRDFRLWLTSMPTPQFPISTLQNGIKMTLEPPTGLRSNLLRTYNAIDDRDLNSCSKPKEYKKLLFGFALFHATVQDRRKFGPIGWNIPYEFTNEDFTVCKRQLKIFLDEYEEIPYKVLNYLGSEINYGGRVTDDKDVRLITTILRTYIRPECLEDKYNFSTSGLYYSPQPLDQMDYIQYIKGLPLNPAPEAFGLHENAEITTAENASRIVLETILSVQPRSTAKGGRSAEDIIIEIASNIEKKTPPPFDFDAVFKKYPTEYTESMNTVLVQEVIRYNRLLVVMQATLVQVKKALKGEIVMSEELELMAKSLSENQVPEVWKSKSFLSLKPLSSWIEDLNLRITFLSDWIKKGTPMVFWISGFFFPQAFITGTLQNYARSHTIAIDKLWFEFKILDDKTYSQIKEKPKDGCYIYGMFLEGARWDYSLHILNHSKPKELYTDLPLIWLYPVADRVPPKIGIYNCPIYKVLSRAGTLSTTGHSTNFVMFIELPSADLEDQWIKAGVAAFLSLRY